MTKIDKIVNKRNRYSDFYESVWNACTLIPGGMVSTYKEIGRKIGTKGYRAVGSALNKNPYAPEVPCHRVVNSDGTIGGFAHGKAAKKKMLEKEGIWFEKDRIVDFDKKLFCFK